MASEVVKVATKAAPSADSSAVMELGGSSFQSLKAVLAKRRIEPTATHEKATNTPFLNLTVDLRSMKRLMDWKAIKACYCQHSKHWELIGYIPSILPSAITQLDYYLKLPRSGVLRKR